MQEHRKYLLTALFAVIVLGGVTSWFTTGPPSPSVRSAQVERSPSKPTSPEPQDEIYKLLSSLQQETQINFSNLTTTRFNWHTGTDQVGVLGMGFGAWGISDAQQQAIENFFSRRDFKVDSHNIYSGALGGAMGYRHDSIVCLVSGGVDDNGNGEQWVEVGCGKL